jgi:hypothetical protein
MNIKLEFQYILLYLDRKASRIVQNITNIQDFCIKLVQKLTIIAKGVNGFKNF